MQDSQSPSPAATPEGEFADLGPENNRIWDANANWWDDRIGDGNQFQLKLIEPATLRLMAPGPGQTILDVGCGAGRMARLLAAAGASVVGFDASANFIHRARQRSAGCPIEYHVIDGCDEQAMLALGVGRFDAAVSTMALMDMPRIGPVFHAVARLLKPGGAFVFTIQHPSFTTARAQHFAEMGEGPQGQLVTMSGVKVLAYRTPTAYLTEGIIDQPNAQYCFHRPLAVLLGAAFSAGFMVDALVEPTLEPSATAGRGLRWDDMPEIPPVLAVRLRLIGVS